MPALLHSRFLRTFVCCALVLLIPASYFFFIPPPTPSPDDSLSSNAYSSNDFSLTPDLSLGSVPDLLQIEAPSGGGLGLVAEDVLSGGAIMPHLGNETAKAELGRATWKLLHLITLRYPDNPTTDERQALKSYFHLFARLYPCGECAAHFLKLLEKYPVQSSSRKSASLWLCHLHNQVNTRLLKDQFDCATLDATYDCGCGPEPDAASAGGEGKSTTGGVKDEVTGLEIMKGGR